MIYYPSTHLLGVRLMTVAREVQIVRASHPPVSVYLGTPRPPAVRVSYIGPLEMLNPPLQSKDGPFLVSPGLLYISLQ